MNMANYLGGYVSEEGVPVIGNKMTCMECGKSR